MAKIGTEREAIVERARQIVAGVGKPEPRELPALIRALHEPDRSRAPESGRTDVALALAPVAEELPPETRLLLHLVLHDWDGVSALLTERPDLRPVLFHYLWRETPALRRWMLRQVTPSFCQNDVERMIRDVAAGNFAAVQGWALMEELRELLVSLLRELLRSPYWGLFHKDQAARVLRSLGEKAPPVARPYRRLRSGDGSVLQSTALDQEEADPPELAPLLQHLRGKGLCVDGRRIYPAVRVGTITGRITYSDPPVQTWSRTEREGRIRPSPGCVMVMLDYSQIEPLVLLNVLVHRLWLAIPDLPQGDVYLWFSPEDRDLGKRIVNTLINGGSPAVVDPHPGALAFIRAMEQFRDQWARECRARGVVITLSGREIPLPEGTNPEGKMMNRLVQGSAADIFNAAVAEIHRQSTQEGWRGSVAFLLYDEVWVEAERGHEEEIARRCVDIMRRSAAMFCPYRAPDVRVTIRR